MTDRLAAAHELGREWGKRTGEPHPLTVTVRDCLFFAGFPTDISHRNAFRDGAKSGADGTDNLKPEGRTMAKTWTIQYRQGGTDRFRWVRTRAFSSYADACATRNDLERAGYLAHLWPTDQLAIAGYPTGYTSDDKRDLTERNGWMVPAPTVIPELDGPEYQDGLYEAFPDCA